MTKERQEFINAFRSTGSLALLFVGIEVSAKHPVQGMGLILLGFVGILPRVRVLSDKIDEFRKGSNKPL